MWPTSSRWPTFPAWHSDIFNSFRQFSSTADNIHEKLLSFLSKFPNAQCKGTQDKVFLFVGVSLYLVVIPNQSFQIRPLRCAASLFSLSNLRPRSLTMTCRPHLPIGDSLPPWLHPWTPHSGPSWLPCCFDDYLVVPRVPQIPFLIQFYRLFWLIVGAHFRSSNERVASGSYHAPALFHCNDSRRALMI